MDMRKFFSLLCWLVMGCSCVWGQEVEILKPGVVLTFDDVQNVKNWINYLELFTRYDAKATLFINAPNRLSNNDVESLKIFSNAGFAIGCHGYNHVKSIDHIAENGVEIFMSEEIIAAENELFKRGFEAKVFAYPMSQHNDRTDAILSTVFKHARSGAGIPKGKRMIDCDIFFTPVDEVEKKFTLVGKGCDGTDEIFLENEIFPALERAKKRNEIVAFYSHNIAPEAASHFIRPEILEKLLKKIVELDLAFYTLEELPSSFGK